MWPIDWAYYPKGVHAALIETFHIATLGTLSLAHPRFSDRAARGQEHHQILRH